MASNIPYELKVQNIGTNIWHTTGHSFVHSFDSNSTNIDWVSSTVLGPQGTYNGDKNQT